MIKVWSNAVDDPNAQGAEDKDMPKVVIKFIPHKRRFLSGMTDQSLFDAVTTGGNGEWLEGYECLQYMAIFFVLSPNSPSDEEAEVMEDDVDDEDSTVYPEFINTVLNDIYRENERRFDATYNAHLKGKDKHGLMSAKRLQSEFHNLMDSHLQTTGNRLDNEHCIDLSYVPKSAEDMHRLFQSFLTCHKKTYSIDRMSDMHIMLDYLMTPTSSFDDKLKECEDRYEDIDWGRLLVSRNMGRSFAWNLNAPFVICINESDFTMVSWEHTVQPHFCFVPEEHVESSVNVESYIDHEASPQFRLVSSNTVQ
ncbi:hypothetical protein CYMTET_48474 [Cymbomonas tetramitiformis]|uniref:Uncharacterized protein n=1 Tax=Cymbomonas tetramitiformis TaxID=36881 RepID=A0AAE0BTY8_9CHLO|nr:hypothetical protein CYMTET_48474 [Cymbomonas tetramitiformis]